MQFKGCVVVQGKVNINYLKKIKQAFSGYQLIHSCWEGDDGSLFDESDIVVVNEIPTNAGPGNFYLQKKSTIEGMKKAIELGWNRALKWRSDMWCKDGDKLFQKFDSDSLNLYFWANHLDGYITDFFMEGECSDIITLFDTELPQYKYNYPEFGITFQFFRNGFDKKCRFMGHTLDRECDIYWPKNKLWFSRHQRDAWFVSGVPITADEWIPKRRGKPINLFE